jgi:hypothetical protein
MQVNPIVPISYKLPPFKDEWFKVPSKSNQKENVEYFEFRPIDYVMPSTYDLLLAEIPNLQGITKEEFLAMLDK